MPVEFIVMSTFKNLRSGAVARACNHGTAELRAELWRHMSITRALWSRGRNVSAKLAWDSEQIQPGQSSKALHQ